MIFFPQTEMMLQTTQHFFSLFTSLSLPLRLSYPSTPCTKQYLNIIYTVLIPNNSSSWEEGGDAKLLIVSSFSDAKT